MYEIKTIKKINLLAPIFFLAILMSFKSVVTYIHQKNWLRQLVAKMGHIITLGQNEENPKKILSKKGQKDDDIG